jgi:hypothetical protein
MKGSVAALIGLGLVLASGGAAWASADLPDGDYDCLSEMGSLMGTIRIDGDSFAGPAYDGQYDGSYPFSTSGGTVIWGGALEGLDSGGNSVASTVIRDGGIDIVVHTSGGNFERISCDLRQ